MSIKSRIALLTDGKQIPAAPDGSVLSTLSWEGFTVEKHLLSPGELPEHTILDHRLTITTGKTPVNFEFREKGKWRQVKLVPGSFSMQNHEDLGTPRWLNEFEFLAIAIKPEFYKKITAAEVDHRLIELITQRGQLDSHVQQFSNLLGRELIHNGGNGRLYGELLSMSFAMYLLNNYSSSEKKITEPKGKLFGLQIKNLLDYTASHLDQDISLETLASQVNLSPFHFAKSFKRTTNVSPHQFVLNFRIEKAMEMIKNKSQTLTEISHQVGFYDQSHFTNSFKRVVGTTPKKYQKSIS
ncbi:MAG: AraC family transcriptional regulator [Bacteroidota bacterium]